MGKKSTASASKAVKARVGQVSPKPAPAAPASVNLGRPKLLRQIAGLVNDNPANPANPATPPLVIRRMVLGLMGNDKDTKDAKAGGAHPGF